jgi:hypothetical protein
MSNSLLADKLHKYTFTISNDYPDRILEADISVYMPQLGQKMISNIEEFKASALRVGQPMNALSLVVLLFATLENMIKSHAPKSVVLCVFDLVPEVLRATIPNNEISENAVTYWKSEYAGTRLSLTQ